MTDPALASGLVEGLVGAAVGIVVGGIAMKYGAKANGGNSKPHHCPEHYQFVEKVSGLMADMDWVCTVLQQVYGHRVKIPRRNRGEAESLSN